MHVLHTGRSEPSRAGQPHGQREHQTTIARLSVHDNATESGAKTMEMKVRLSLVHPFMQRFGGVTVQQIEPLLRVAAAIALSEVTARASGVKQAGVLRRNINEFLRNGLIDPATP